MNKESQVRRVTANLPASLLKEACQVSGRGITEALVEGLTLRTVKFIDRSWDLVDTSSWVSYFSSSGPSVIDEALAEGRVFLPPVVGAELVIGRLTFRQRADLESFLSDLPLCAVDFEHWLRVGALRAQLSSVGISVSTPDAHIAQCALDLHGELLSDDGIFLKIAKKTPLKLLGG